MRYLDLFSGIGTASVAFDPLGWQCVGHSEIDRFASAVLSYRYPDVANFGDINRFEEWPDVAVDLVCGGSPCQAFSIAGLRDGLADPRGKLMLTYLAVVRRYRPRWIIWENVTGVLSLHRGKAFETLLRGLAECGYHASWRVLDSQYVRVDGYPRAVPQRRNRVFLVGHSSDWRYPAQVLLEPESLRWSAAPGRQAFEGNPERDAGGAGTGSVPDVANVLTNRMHKGVNTTMDEGQTMIPVDVEDVSYALTSGMHHSANRVPSEQGTLVPVGFDSKRHGHQEGVAPALRAMGHSGSHANAGGQMAVAHGTMIRRLMPIECERLQGLPDDWTNIPWRGRDHAPDGPRYKAIGNAWAVPVGRWVARRIEMVEAFNA